MLFAESSISLESFVRPLYCGLNHEPLTLEANTLPLSQQCDKANSAISMIFKKNSKFQKEKKSKSVGTEKT